jgi:S1-C subfamily serine protease
VRRIVSVAIVMMGSAGALAAPVDRSSLSLEENVIINTVCGPKRAESGGAYDSCVAQEVEALKAHPSPDRSALSATRNRAIEERCSYLRRQGIGEYNDCLAKAIAAPAKDTDVADAEDDLTPNFAKTFAKSAEGKGPDKDPDEAKPVAAAAPAPLPGPAKALPKRTEASEKPILTPADLYKKVERSVFIVVATPSAADARARNIAQGSAVAVTEQLLLTNCHVVNERPLIRIIQGTTVDEATLVAGDVATDRCIIKAATQKLVPVAGVRSYEGLAVGERVFTVGTPYQLERTMSEGLLSGLRTYRGRHLVQTSAPFSPGSSGGGLFDEHGNLVGITTLVLLGRATQNLNFAIAAADFWR